MGFFAVVGFITVAYIVYRLGRVVVVGSAGTRLCQQLGLSLDQSAAAAAMVRAYAAEIRRAPTLAEQSAIIVMAATLPDRTVMNAAVGGQIGMSPDGEGFLMSAGGMDFVHGFAREISSGTSPAVLLRKITAHRVAPNVV